MRYIKELTQAQQQELKEGFEQGTTKRFRIRCQSILLSYQGYQIKQLMELYDVGRDTVRGWFNQWESQGIKGLKDKPKSGRPTKLRLDNPSHVELLKRKVKGERQKLDKIRAELEQELGLQMSRRTLQRFLKSAVFDGAAFASALKSEETQKNTNES
ncbi:MAG: helix-turn-helix domain containing protein [Saprospiraceae bacterium]|nr:helix-turn-helix domain containing protein [Saprospiraceae bacterium]